MDEANETIGSFPAPIPGRCIYGFVLFLFSLVSLVMYYMWAFIPMSLLEAAGLDFLPSKYWAISIPIFAMILVALFGFFLYPAINLLLTPPIDHYSTIFDSYYIKYTPHIAHNLIPPISDLPLDYVSKELYITKLT